MFRIACAVLEKLRADAKDDLYFAGGRDRLTFRNLLASGHLPQALLASCVDLSPSALGGAGAAMEMWTEILTGAVMLSYLCMFMHVLGTLMRTEHT